MEIQCAECATYLTGDAQISKNQLKIKWVVAFNALMMLGEVFVGYTSGSMSLVAEGWHMGSHVGALTITLIAYRLAKSARVERHLSFGAGKFIPLGGYTSAVALGIVALIIIVESVERLFSPVEILFNEALVIAAAGLVANLISAWLLGGDHTHVHPHEHEHSASGHKHSHVHDHNIRSAFLHVLADAGTSLLAIVALTLGKVWHLNFFDPLIGIFGALVIFSWSYQLCRDTGWELLDGHAKHLDWAKLRGRLEVAGTRIVDFHAWRIAPRALAAELRVESPTLRGADYYREILRREFGLSHLVVEEQLIKKSGTPG